MSSLVEDINSVTKSSFTIPIFVSLSCGHGINDMNGFFGEGCIGVAYKGCSHITTNLGIHRAQTYMFICAWSLGTKYVIIN